MTNKGVDISADIGFDGSLGARLIKSLDTKQNLVLNSDAKLVINNNQYVDNALTLGMALAAIVDYDIGYHLMTSASTKVTLLSANNT